MTFLVFMDDMKMFLDWKLICTERLLCTVELLFFEIFESTGSYYI